MMRYIISFNQAFSNYDVLDLPVNQYSFKFIFKKIVSGNLVKFEFANEFDLVPLNILSAKVNIHDEEESAIPITFNQKSTFSVPTQSNLWSDEVEIKNRTDEFLYVYLQMENSTNQLKSAANMFQDSRIVIDYTPDYSHKFLPQDVQLLVGIKSIANVTEDEYTSISFFGDSLTNHAYFSNSFIDYLNDSGFKTIGLNAGISGNKLLSSGEGSISKWKFGFGRSGIHRFEKDVMLNQPNVIIALIGLNDLFHPGTNESIERLPTATLLIDGIQQLMQIAKVRNSRYIPITLPPFHGALNHEIEAWTEAKETIRQEVNLWIRKQDDLIDLDKFVANPGQPEKLNASFDGGDHIHFSREAGKIIGEFMAQQFLELKNIN